MFLIYIKILKTSLPLPTIFRHVLSRGKISNCKNFKQNFVKILYGHLFYIHETNYKCGKFGVFIQYLFWTTVLQYRTWTHFGNPPSSTVLDLMTPQPFPFITPYHLIICHLSSFNSSEQSKMTSEPKTIELTKER